MRDEGGSSDTNFQQDFSSYRVFDEHYEEVGKVDDVFVDGNDRPQYIGVKMGFLGMKSTLVPVDLVRINDRREVLEIAASKNAIENAPGFDDETISPEHEAEIQQYYGLTSNVGDPQRDSAGSYREPGGDTSVDLDYGERGETEEPVETSRPRMEERPPVEEPPRVEEPRTSSQPGREEVGMSRRAEDDEITIQRTEEELRTGTREREAGSVNVRRRVRTDRERVRVPKKKEEVIVERVPVEGEPVAERPQQGSAGVEPGEEEIRIPVVEEEVVVEKRPVVKEELRIKKRIVEEEEIIEEDVRKEEIDIEGDKRD